MAAPRKFVLFALLVMAGMGAVSGFGGCSKADDPWPEGKSPRLLVTIPALYSFAANVAGDDAAVVCLLKTTGPHDYQPNPRDSIKLRGADRFFVVGLDLDETLATRLRDTSGNLGLPIVEVGERLDNKIKADKDEGEDEKAESHDHHHHGEFDPHVWLGIPEAMCMVEVIRDELKQLKPDQASEYDRRAKEYNAKLSDLLTYGRKGLDKLKKEDRKLVSFHDSLGYFARALDLQIAGTIEKRPGVEVNPHDLKKLVDACVSQKVRVIAIEPQYPAKGAEMLVEQVGKTVPGACTVVVDPLETAAAEDFGPEHQFGKDFYERKMKENIDNLVKALK